MPLSFVGDYPEMKRIRTGLTSFDVAVAGNIKTQGVGALGMPLRCGYHIYSKHTGIGKSVICFSLLGMVSGATGKGLAILPIDTFARPVAEQILEFSGADGEVEFIHELSHADGTARLEKAIQKKNVVGTLLDSAAAYTSTARRENGNDDSSMGRDAMGLSNHVSHMKNFVDAAEDDKIWIMTNQLFQNIGQTFGAMGYHTRGGNAPNLKTSIHIKLDYVYAPQLVSFPAGRLLQGEVEKNSFGITDQIFRVFVLGGFGIHRGLTAAYDCVMYGLATGGETETKAFTIDGKKYQSPRKLMELGPDDKEFDPFFDLLSRNQAAIMNTVMTKKKARAKIESEKEEKKKPKSVEVDQETGEITENFDEPVDTMGLTPEEMMEG